MGAHYPAKVFKSGNSVALRLPKVLGLKDGDEMRIEPNADGSMTIRKASDDLDRLMSLYGCMSPGFMADGRGDIEQEERDWSRDPR